MIRPKDVLIGFLGGVAGGALVDLIYITFAGPSFLLSSIVGLSERYQVFFGHLFLGGIFGILFVVILNKLSRFNFNIWSCGVVWGLICMGVLGGIPSLFVRSPVTAAMFFFSLTVWLLYGLTLAAAIKLFKQ
ncbi:MAG: hypothetical protein Q7R75_00270 [bacterium]|nr:hypothetical protein [bacterium]